MMQNVNVTHSIGIPEDPESWEARMRECLQRRFTQGHEQDAQYHDLVLQGLVALKHGDLLTDANFYRCFDAPPPSSAPWNSPIFKYTLLDAACLTLSINVPMGPLTSADSSRLKNIHQFVRKMPGLLQDVHYALSHKVSPSSAMALPLTPYIPTSYSLRTLHDVSRS